MRRWRRTVARGRRLPQNERGATAAFVAGGLVIFIGATAMAVDVGHLMKVRGESQRTADLAALAGASAFIDAFGSSALQSTIHARAIGFAAQNEVDGVAYTLPATDITTDVANERVTVTIRHTAATGNAIPTVFAGMFGIGSVDVVTVATAEAFPAGGANCILPFMLPDEYDENGGLPDNYDGPPDYYEPYDPYASPPSPTATGYRETDRGKLVVIKPGNRNRYAQPNPSWYYPIVVYGPGGSLYRDAIAGCVDPNIILAVGDSVSVEPGAMIGPTRQGVNALVAQAPTHQWSTTNNCVIDTAAGANPNVCIASPRLRPVPLMAPPDAPANGRKSVPIQNWVGVFIVGMSGNDVIARVAGYSSFINGGAGGGGGSGSLAKAIRLVG